MADSNSKKPMALLLLVVVAVLVVIMVSGGEETPAWAGHGALADEKSCTDAKGTWTPGADKDDEATDVDETKGSCAAPVYADLTTQQDCEAAHGEWKPGAEKDDEATPEVDETKGSCAEKTEKVTDKKEEDGNKDG